MPQRARQRIQAPEVIQILQSQEHEAVKRRQGPAAEATQLQQLGQVPVQPKEAALASEKEMEMAQ